MTDTTEWTNPNTGEKARVRMTQICTKHKALQVVRMSDELEFVLRAAVSAIAWAAWLVYVI